MIKPEDKIAVGWIDGGQVMSGFAAYISNLLLSRPVISDVVVASGPYLSYNRNRMVELFLQTDATWLFSLDSDLKITPEDFDYLCETADAEKRAIVGGKYYLPFDNGQSIHPSAMEKVPGTKLGAWIDPSKVFDGKILDNLHSVGFGYSLTHRDVFETLKTVNLQKDPNNELSWFQDSWTSEYKNWMSDDVYFFIQVVEQGINVALDTRATSQHLKVMHIGDSSMLTVRNDFRSGPRNGHNHGHDHNVVEVMPSQRVSWWARRKKNV
jgi:hypothetical protein